MKCNKCGAERQKYQLDEGGCRTAETLPQCRDAISAQLASMTKRAEEAEVWGQDTVCRLTNEKEAAEAKLATARDSVFELAAFLRQECARVAHEKSGDANVGHEVGRVDVLPFVKAAIEGMDMPLRALGIDPSKEQEK